MCRFYLVFSIIICVKGAENLSNTSKSSNHLLKINLMHESTEQYGIKNKKENNNRHLLKPKLNLSFYDSINYRIFPLSNYDFYNIKSEPLSDKKKDNKRRHDLKYDKNIFMFPFSEFYYAGVPSLLYDPNRVKKSTRITEKNGRRLDSEEEFSFSKSIHDSKCSLMYKSIPLGIRLMGVVF